MSAHLRYSRFHVVGESKGTKGEVGEIKIKIKSKSGYKYLRSSA
jgi:hypothetical protein